MATTDNAVQFDVKFVDEYGPKIQLVDPTGQFSSEDILRVMRDALAPLGLIQRDRLVELAIAATGGHEVTSVAGQDFSDGSDAKTVVSNARNNNVAKGVWTNSFAIRKVNTKKGALRIVAYNRVLDKFHYFVVPRSAYSHLKANLEITIETYSGQTQAPVFTGTPRSQTKWWNFEVASFDELCKQAA